MTPTAKQPTKADTLRPIDVEVEYKIKRQYLANRRSMGLPPAYIRVGRRLILYYRKDIESLLASHRVEPSRQTSVGKGRSR